MNLREVQQRYDFSGQTVSITGGAGVSSSVKVAALANCGAPVAK